MNIFDMTQCQLKQLIKNNPRSHELSRCPDLMSLEKANDANQLPVDAFLEELLQKISLILKSPKSPKSPKFPKFPNRAKDLVSHINSISPQSISELEILGKAYIYFPYFK